MSSVIPNESCQEYLAEKEVVDMLMAVSERIHLVRLYDINGFHNLMNNVRKRGKARANGILKLIKVQHTVYYKYYM